VEITGIEPVTSCMSSKHSNQLSYTSICMIVYHEPEKIAREKIKNRRRKKIDIPYKVWYGKKQGMKCSLDCNVCQNR
jgi:hypothetical protein